MVLWLIGLGLGDEKDITVRGLEAVKSCKHIYLEHYTAILGVDKEKLEKFYGKDIILADREFVEQSAQEMLKLAKTEDVAFLVVGDPFAATTHHDLVLRASEQGIKCEVVHNASIMNAVAQCGLQLYQFGQTVSICFFRDDWRPDSFYDKIKANMVNKFHTLCLLDIKVKEQSFENMMKNIKIYEPPRYMTINCCIEQLLEIEEKRNEHVYSRDTPAFGVARLGQPDQQIVSGTLSELLNIDFGGPLHSLVIASEMHFIEQDMYDFYHWDRARREAEKQKKRLEEEENMRLEAAQRAEQRRREKEQQLLQQKKLEQAQQEASEAAQSSHAAHVQALQARVKAGQISVTGGAGVNSISSSVVASSSVVSGNTTQEDSDDEELANVEPSLF